MVPSGAQFLLLNGAAYPMTDFNLYDFLGALRREVRMLRVPRVEGLWAGAVWGLYRLIEGGPHQALLTLLPACACRAPPPPPIDLRTTAAIACRCVFTTGWWPRACRRHKCAARNCCGAPRPIPRRRPASTSTPTNT